MTDVICDFVQNQKLDDLTIAGRVCKVVFLMNQMAEDFSYEVTFWDRVFL